MAALKVLTYPHPALRQVAPTLTVFDDPLRETIKEMFSLLYQEDGVGLAAPQVGLNLRLFVMDASRDGTQPQCFINPVIIDQKGSTVYEGEGCLSFPGIHVKVTRASEVTLQYQDEFGQAHTLTTTGLAAECIQHEIEHLNGILLIDHLSKLKRMLFLKKLQKRQRQDA